MLKIKKQNGLISIIILSSIFFNYLPIIICLAILIFCEIDEKLNNILTRILSFYITYLIIYFSWNLIIIGINTLNDFILNTINFISTLIDINILKEINYESNIYIQIKQLSNIINNIIIMVLEILKITYVINILNNKLPKNKFINNQINKKINFINSLNKYQ